MRRQLFLGVAQASLVGVMAWSTPAMAETQVGAAGEQAEANAETEESKPNTIVVTASKREQLLQDVPGALTALSEETIERLGLEDFQDYATIVPGLSQRDAGAPGRGTIILRGLNSSAQQLTNTTAFYLGDVPVSASGFLSVTALLTPNPDLVDASRIEVLKGPQGTIWGATSLGGLVRIVPNDPDTSDVSGFAQAEYETIDGGGDGYSLRGGLNVPIIDGVLAFRASGGYRKIGGFIDNIATGTDNFNTAEIYGGRAALRFTPNSDLTIDASAFIQTTDSVGSSAQANLKGTLTSAFGEYANRAVADLPSSIEYQLYALSVDYDFGPVSWQTTASYGDLETSLLGELPEYIAFVAAFVPPGTASLIDASPSTEKYTVESRLVSDRIGSFEFIAGAFYTSEKSAYRTIISLVNPATLTPLPGPFGTLFLANSLSDYEEIAGFGNLTFYLSDSFDITGGLRVAHSSDLSSTGAPVDGIPASSFFVPRAQQDFSDSSTATTYLGTLRWRPSDNLSLFARAASGFRPGGPQTNAAPPPGAQTSIDPDTVWNYEVGMKGTFLDGKLSAEASVYRIDWSDIQLPSLFGGTVLQSNGGEARVEGFELAFTANPGRNTTISAQVGYTDARLLDVPAAVTASIGAVAGDQLPLTPKWTVALIADQVVPIGDNVDATFGGTLRFRSEMPSGYPGDLLNVNIELPPMEVLDLRAGLEFEAFTITARVDNVLDEIAFNGAQTNALFPGQPTVTLTPLIRPRTFSLGISTKF